MEEGVLDKIAGFGHTLSELELDKSLEIRWLVLAKVKGMKYRGGKIVSRCCYASLSEVLT